MKHISYKEFDNQCVIPIIFKYVNDQCPNSE